MSANTVPLGQEETPDRWLKIFAENTTDGLWDSQGQMVFSDELPLTQETRKRLAAWCEWVDDFEDYLPASRRSPPVFPLDDFNAEGLAITEIIRRELPDWMVVYDPLPLEWGAKT